MFNLIKIYVYYETNKRHFPYYGNQRNLYLATCAALDPSIDLQSIPEIEKFNIEMLEKNPHCDVIGNSFVDMVFEHFKIFRLHAAFHNASGFMKSYQSKGPGYCYPLSGTPINSRIIGHVTGLVYCLYLKFYTPHYFYNYFDV